ncbi:zinc ribbon domain-containing protein [Endozoicomonas sp. YOMI1]
MVINLSGIAVRSWECDCGTTHDRDINAACNINDRKYLHRVNYLRILFE